MELMQLRYFLEVAESGHVTRSAERLHIAQPALTQSIRRLEKDVGVPLFVRHGRNIVLTEYGIFLKKRLEPLISELDELPGQLQTMAHLEHATIHLNVLAATSFTTEAIIAFKKEYPELIFRLLQNSEKDLYDIGITTRLFYQPPREDASQFVCTEKIFLAVPNIGKYRYMEKVQLAKMKDENFISLFGSKQLRWICDKFCLHAGFKPRISFESDSPAAVKNMIAANMGVGFWPEFTWGKLDSDHVILLEIEEPVCQRDILVTCRHNKTDTRAVDTFFAFLTECFKAQMVTETRKR